MAEFQKSFHAIDRNNTGQITMDDLREYMQRMNYKDSFVEKWMKLFKPNADGVITYESYCKTLGLIPRKPVPVVSKVSELPVCVRPSSPRKDDAKSPEDKEKLEFSRSHTDDIPQAVTGVIHQPTVEIAVSEKSTSQVVPKGSKAHKRTRKSPKTSEHDEPSHLVQNPSPSLTDTSRESEFERIDSVSPIEILPVQSSCSVVPSEMDESFVVLEVPAEGPYTSNAPSESPKIVDHDSHKFPFLTSEIQTKSDNILADPRVLDGQEELIHPTTVSIEPEESKGKQSKGKIKGKGKHKGAGSRPLSESDKISVEEIPAVTGPTAANTERAKTDTDHQDDESVDFRVQQSPTQVSDHHSVPDVIPTSIEGPSGLDGIKQPVEPGPIRETHSKGKVKGKGKHKSNVSRTASESEQVGAEEVQSAKPFPTPESGPEKMDVEPIATAAIELMESFDSLGQQPPSRTTELYTVSDSIPAASVDAIVLDASNDIIVESTEADWTTVKHSKRKSEKKGKHKEEVPCTVSDGEPVRAEQIPLVAAPPTMPLGPDAMDMDRPEMVSFEVPKTQSSDYLHSPSPNSEVLSTTDDILKISEAPINIGETKGSMAVIEEHEVPKGKHSKGKSKGKGKPKSNVSRTASESECVGTEELSSAGPAVEMRLEKKDRDHEMTETLESTNRVEPSYHSPTRVTPEVQATADDASVDKASPCKPKECEPPLQEDIEPEFPKEKPSKGKGKRKHKPEGYRTVSGSENISTDEISLAHAPLVNETEPSLEVVEKEDRLTQELGASPAELSTDSGSSRPLSVSNYSSAVSTPPEVSKGKDSKGKGKGKVKHNEQTSQTAAESEPIIVENVLPVETPMETEEGPETMNPHPDIAKERAVLSPDDPSRQRGRKRNSSSQEGEPPNELVKEDAHESTTLSSIKPKKPKQKVKEQENKSTGKKDKLGKSPVPTLATLEPDAVVAADEPLLSGTVADPILTSDVVASPGASQVELKRKRKRNNSRKTEVDSVSQLDHVPVSESKRKHISSKQLTVESSVTKLDDDQAKELCEMSNTQLEDAPCCCCPFGNRKEVDPNALFAHVPFWMADQRKRSVIRRRRLMRKLDMKRKRAEYREQTAGDAKSTSVTVHRFPRSFETQPQPDRCKSEIRKRRRARKRLINARVHQVKRILPKNTKKKTKKRLTALDRWKVRTSLQKRGVVVILLGGRHRGKRVVCLGRQRSTGLLLVTGPFRYNGCPLRRVHPNMVIATKTRVDLGKFRVPLRVHSKEYFARKKLDKKPALEAQLGLTDNPDQNVTGKLYVPSEIRKEDQLLIDEEVCKCIKTHEDSRMLIKYLRSLFSLSKHDKPHAMQF